MPGYSSKHTYAAFFNAGELMDGKVACPTCGESTLHPTGHVASLEPTKEYSPNVSLTAWCECGQAVVMEFGNYKGHFAIDIRALVRT